MERSKHAYSTFRGSHDGVHHAYLTLPAAPSPAPVVVNLHGGFWKTVWGLDNLATSELLNAFGSNVATWDVEYARVDQTDPAASPAGGGWPHTCLDVLAALNALAQLPEPTRAKLDLQRVYLCGHSAGAHLALWLGVISRYGASDLSRLADIVNATAGADGATAMREGVHASIAVLGVAGLAPVVSLSACAAAGLSDYHDAALNFLWRLLPADAADATTSGQLGAACPLALWCELAAQAEERTGTDSSLTGATPTLPALRLLLCHGLSDTDVPASLSLSLAAAAWTHPRPPPLWMQLLKGCDHYDIAGLCAPLAHGERDAAAAAAHADAAAARARGAGLGGAPLTESTLLDAADGIRPWARVAAALCAFVAHDDSTLNALCCTALPQAEALVAEALPPVCARQTIGRIVTGEEAFTKWAATEGDSAAAMARGLRRWGAWTGEAPTETVRRWLDERP